MSGARRPVLPFAPGAGAPSSSAWMRGWAERLATIGAVSRFDYPYVLRGSKRPDRLPVLIAAHRAAIDAACPGEVPVVLVGKSMGGRVGCHVAAEGDPRVCAVVCFGYPLIGASGARRDEVLRALRVPILFVQGTRDPMCPLDQLDAVRAEMAAPNELHVVPTGDHSLEITRTRARIRDQDAHDAETHAIVAAFVARWVPPIATLGMLRPP